MERPLEHRCLTVNVYITRQEMGAAAAKHTAAVIREALSRYDTINVAFAAAPSQNEFLSSLVSQSDVNWRRIRAFHLDEYLNLPTGAPQRFSGYLDRHIFRLVPFKEVYYIDPGNGAPPAEICERYSELLRRYPLHIACIGIGENGHIAFNDPPAANFEDPDLVKVVKLDETCRMQQVHDGCFSSINEVPTHAITMTIPAIMAAKHIVCVVPGERKREAVFKTLEGPVDTSCPASVLRRHPAVTFFFDRASAALILRR